MAPGGDGLSQTDVNGAKKQAIDGRTTDKTGINAVSGKDCRVGVAKNLVRYTEQDTWLEIKGAKGETKVGGFFELVVGMKHAMTAGLKTAIDLSYSKTFNIGPYTTEMLAAKYEIIHRKVEKVLGQKDDDYTVCKYEKNKGPWKKTIAGAKKTVQPLEKKITDKMEERAGAILKQTAAKYRGRADHVKQRIENLKVKISNELSVKCSDARIKFRDFNAHIASMEYEVGKFERKCKAMDDAVSGLLEFKGSGRADHGASIKLKGSLLKFTAEVVKLGE